MKREESNYLLWYYSFVGLIFSLLFTGLFVGIRFYTGILLMVIIDLIMTLIFIYFEEQHYGKH